MYSMGEIVPCRWIPSSTFLFSCFYCLVIDGSRFTWRSIVRCPLLVISQILNLTLSEILSCPPAGPVGELPPLRGRPLLCLVWLFSPLLSYPLAMVSYHFQVAKRGAGSRKIGGKFLSWVGVAINWLSAFCSRKRFKLTDSFSHGDNSQDPCWSPLVYASHTHPRPPQPWPWFSDGPSYGDFSLLEPHCLFHTSFFART